MSQTADSVETAPSTKGTITLGDFVFEPPAGFNGNGTYAVENKGNEVHELAIVQVRRRQDARRREGLPPDAAGDAAARRAAAVHRGGGAGRAQPEPDRRGWTWSSPPGQYAMLCFFPDPTKDDLPHALEGMIKAFTVTS